MNCRKYSLRGRAHKKGTIPSDIADCPLKIVPGRTDQLAERHLYAVPKEPSQYLRSTERSSGTRRYVCVLPLPRDNIPFHFTCLFPHHRRQQPLRSSGCGGVFSFTRKLFSHTKQVSWLTDLCSISPSRAIRSGTQWTFEISLPVYSDRIAQASHLIPSSVPSGAALDVAILNYTSKL